MTYHVHSLHVRSVKVTSGTYTLDGQTRIPSPPPLHEAEKFGGQKPAIDEEEFDL